jgi:hypothetical protein
MNVIGNYLSLASTCHRVRKLLIISEHLSQGSPWIDGGVCMAKL